MMYFDQAATSYPKPLQVRQAVLHAMDACTSPGGEEDREAVRAAESVDE